MAAKERLKASSHQYRGAGDRIVVGLCPRCNKPCGLSSANKKGVTCRRCKLQFDAEGVLIGATGASKKKLTAAQSAAKPLDMSHVKLENPTISFELEDLEAILYRENAVIAGEDVPILLQTLLLEKKLHVPERIKKEIQDAREARGDA